MMKRITLTVCLFVATLSCTWAQQGVGINTDNSNPDPSAILDVKATDKGMLIPRMTEAEKNAIPVPALSLLIYQTDGAAGFWYFDGAVWQPISGGANDLDGAYDEGGAGVGRIITADNGAVYIDGPDGMHVTGQVGIGNTAPTHQLHVTGGVAPITTSNTTVTLTVNATGGSATIALPIPPGATSVLVTGIRMRGDLDLGSEVGNFSINGTNFATNLNTGAQNCTYVATGAVPYDISALTTPSAGGTVNLTVQASGNVNSGVGCIAPVALEAEVDIEFTAIGGGGGTPAVRLGPGTARIDPLSGSGNQVLIADNNGDLVAIPDGAASTVLTTDGAGNYTWAAPAVGATSLWTEVTPNVRYTLAQFPTDAQINYGDTDLSGQSFNDGNGVFWGTNPGEDTGMFTDGDQLTLMSPGDNQLIQFWEEDGHLEVANITGAGAYNQISDRNLKQNIQRIEGGLDMIMRLNGYTYEFIQNAEDRKKGTPVELGMGVIAQELAEVAPRLAKKSDQGHYLVNYDGIVPILIEATKEQQELIKKQQTEIDQLKAEVEELKALKAEMAELRALLNQKKDK